MRDISRRTSRRKGGLGLLAALLAVLALLAVACGDDGDLRARVRRLARRRLAQPGG